MTNKRSPFGPLAVTAILAVAVMIITTNVKADDSPTPEDLANLQDIRNNQVILDENRPAYQRFMDAKGWNELEVAELAKNNWCVKFDKDPSKVDLERCSLTGGQESHENLQISGHARKLLTGPCKGDEKCICVNDAIFQHDSSWATAGVGARSLGPCNMRVPSSWTPSVPMSHLDSVNGEFARFETLQDGVTACVELWERFYEGKTAFATAKIWTGNANNPKYGSKPDERAYINAIAACD